MTPQKGDAPYGIDPSGNPLDRYGLSRPVWLLGWVSFFTDTASEMVYPLLPLFLTRVLGAGANRILKIASGWLADRSGAPLSAMRATPSFSCGSPI